MGVYDLYRDKGMVYFVRFHCAFTVRPWRAAGFRQATQSFTENLSKC
jgi:hypothetical protein